MAGAGNLRLMVWNLKAGPVLKAHGAHFLLRTLRGARHYLGAHGLWESPIKCMWL